MPQKLATTEALRDGPRWPVSPRLRSPPPITNKPSLPPPRRPESEAPTILVQRSTPSSIQDDDVDTDDVHLQTGLKTPARVSSTSTLETVQEASPLASPVRELGNSFDNLENSVTSAASSQVDVSDDQSLRSYKPKSRQVANESGSEAGVAVADRRSTSAMAPPPLTSRHSSTATLKAHAMKGKASEATQTMTVETETVTSIPQVALAQGAGVLGSNSSLRTKPSSETIRPKKEKRKSSRKQPSLINANASSKADIFEAKVASALEQANSSDSEETFVYDSNPPDGRDRPQRYHSRTPSATSMMSQVDRAGMRSIPFVMESAVPAGGYKKGMKFVNVNNFNNSSNDGLGDDDGKGTGRSNAGSTRGTARHHHHVGNRWGRNQGGNSHASLFAEESPFLAGPGRSATASQNARQSSRPPSPRFGFGRGPTSSRRGTPMSGAYDLEDTTTGPEETTPLIQSSMRSTRSARNRRLPVPLRALEQQTYRQQPSFLNRFASCLVLTIMLLLVISGAIGFMFATSQPLTDIELISMTNVLASEQELMLDITVKAHNPNVVVVAIDSADIEVFAKSPHAGTDSEWWRRPHDSGQFSMRRRKNQSGDSIIQDDPIDDPPKDDTAPNMRLGTVRQFDSPLSFEGSFFHRGVSASTGEIRLQKPGNGTVGGPERWERIMQEEFDLILKGVLKYTLPLSQRIRSVPISGRTTVKPNSANDPRPSTNLTHIEVRS